MKIINEIRQNKRFYISAGIALGIATFFSYARLTRDRYELISEYTIVSGSVYLILLLFWFFSLKFRIIDKDMRKNALSIAFLLMFFIIIRTVKWRVDAAPRIEQLLWYLYYVPILRIPFLMISLILSCNKKLYHKYRLYLKAFSIISILLIFFVLTNGLHYQVFNILKWKTTFDIIEHRWGFYMLVIWILFNVVLGIIILINNSKLEHTNKRIIAPIIVIIFYIIYAIFYKINPAYNAFGFIEFTLMNIIIDVSILEAMIQSGLIPSNKDYVLLFETSNIPMMIVDNDYEIIARTAIGTGISKDNYFGLNSGESLEIGSKRLSSARINGGYVLWLDDVSSLNKSIKEIKKINKSLQLRNDLLEEELKIEKIKLENEEKTNIYLRIDQEISEKRLEINILIDKLNKENEKYILHKICLIGAYIKRISNMILLEEMYGYIDSLELEYALMESNRNYFMSSNLLYRERPIECKLDAKTAKLTYKYISEILENIFSYDIKVKFTWKREGSYFVVENIFTGNLNKIILPKKDKFTNYGLKFKILDAAETKLILIYIPILEG